MLSDYLEKLRRRRTNRVTRKYQFVGLEIAELLGDRPHKALYIKLAKEGDPQKLLRLARDVSDRRRIRNRGGYFMRLVTTDPSMVKILKAKRPRRRRPARGRSAQPKKNHAHRTS